MIDQASLAPPNPSKPQKPNSAYVDNFNFICRVRIRFSPCRWRWWSSGWWRHVTSWYVACWRRTCMWLFPGKILKVETLHMLSDVGDPDICGWNEQPDKNRDFVDFMRMFYVFKKDGQEDTKYGDIGGWRHWALCYTRIYLSHWNPDHFILEIVRYFECSWNRTLGTNWSQLGLQECMITCGLLAIGSCIGYTGLF